MHPLSENGFAEVIDGLSNTILACETRESRMAVWIDGGTAAVVALRYDALNAPTYAGLEHALNFRPYFDYLNPTSEYGPSSMHPGGGLHLLGDASIQFIADSVHPEMYAAMATRNGREMLRDGF